jgi:hypothetical protein
VVALVVDPVDDTELVAEDVSENEIVDEAVVLAVDD